MVNNFNWFIFPCVNPDGYKYTFENDRLWRRNRKPNGVQVGIDLNRNFDCGWKEAESAGNVPFSEPETNNIKTFFENFATTENISSYFALHSWSQLIMFPYAYSYEKAKNYDDLKAIGKVAVDAILRKHGKQYVTGTAIETIYPYSGDSVDWVYEKGYVNLSYLFELRGTPNSMHMFMLPAHEIIPTGEEILEAFIAMIREASTRGYYTKNS